MADFPGAVDTSPKESVPKSTDGVYHPKTKESRAAYEAMLSVIQQQTGAQLDFVNGAAAYGILAVLKNDTLKNSAKKKDIEKLLNPIPNHVFDQLVSIGRLITDFKDAGGEGTGSNAANGQDALDEGTRSLYNEQLKASMSHSELLHMLSLSNEFRFVTVKQDEKEELLELLDRVPSGIIERSEEIKERLEEPSAKVNILLRVYVWRRDHGHSMAKEMALIAQIAERLMRSIFEIVLKKRWAVITLITLWFCKVFASCLEDRYYGPTLELVPDLKPITESIARVELTITPSFQWDDEIHGSMEPFWVLVHNNEKVILHYDYFRLKKENIHKGHILSFTVPIDELSLYSFYVIQVISDRWPRVGSSTSVPILSLPEKGPPPPEVSAGEYPVAMISMRDVAFYSIINDVFKDITRFNLVQSVVYQSLYYTEDDVLVAAPTACGKRICAELAILNDYRKFRLGDRVMRAVYIAPVTSLAKKRYNKWQNTFGAGLGLIVSELTGETAIDLQLLENGQLIVSTPDHWDALSLRWREREHIKQVSLFIVDELHLIGGQNGPVLEVIVSRMRFLANIGNKIRIVAFSHSLEGPASFGDWIGATSANILSFPPCIKPVSLEIHSHSTEIDNFEALMESMSKPTYNAIVQHAENSKPVIVFVPTRKHTRLTAVDLMTLSSVESMYSGGDKPLFLLRSEQELTPYINAICEPALKETLKHGVGYLHEGLTAIDRDIVHELFKTGHIQVCVMTASMCWGTSLRTHLVIVKGTQYYGGRENVFTDYPVSDLLQMMGRCNGKLQPYYVDRPRGMHPFPVDKSRGVCIIFCPSSQMEYYRKFLTEGLPVESQLHHRLHNYLNAAVATGALTNKHEVFGFLMLAFIFRRLMKNHKYYKLLGPIDELSQERIVHHFSRLMDTVFDDLALSKCVRIHDDNLHLSSCSLGNIASDCYISYTTIALFSSSLTEQTCLNDLLDILASASEYEQLPIRLEEEDLIRELIDRLQFPFENLNYKDPHLKAKMLLKLHLSRQLVTEDLGSDQQEVILWATRLLQAMVAVISSNGWLSLVLLAIEVSQMVTQGMWVQDSVLLQLPHFNEDLAKKCQEHSAKSIETVFDLMEMEDNERRELLQKSDSQLIDIANFCNRFPSIALTYDVLDGDNVRVGGDITLLVTLERDLGCRTEVGPVDAPRYPKSKEEGWWLVVGDKKCNQLLAIKRVFMQRNSNVKLDNIAVPNEAGMKNFTLYFMCDSYMGCNQEYSFSVDVKPASGDDGSGPD